MATSVQDSPLQTHQTPAWSEVECRTRLCQRCEKVPFDEGAFDEYVSASLRSRDGLLIYPKQDVYDEWDQYDLRVNFDLVDNWPQLPIITKSAENCDFCKLLETRLRKADLPPEFRRAWIRVELFYCWWNQNNAGLAGLKALVYGKVKERDEFTRLIWLTFMIDADEGECKRWLRLRKRPASDFLCEENISEITARLEERMPTFLPTRLIDLGCCDKPSTFGKLVTREEVLHERRACPMYVALSYPWGSPEQAALQSKTTAENIHDRKTNISLQDLSKVIQDAATVCKRFGVRYLWVDALCIIQGDLQDWERESTTMGNIFQNAHFTIAAAAIDCCHRSFLSQSADVLDIPFISRIEPTVKGTYRLIAGNDSNGNEDCVIQSDYFDDCSGPWRDRGWVFQEIAMSSRLLTFGKTTVTLNNMEEEDAATWFNLFQQGVTYDSWGDLVSAYSDRQLTFQKDKLPAISGLARFFAEHLEDQYLAGIWKNDLFLSLFWHCPCSPSMERQSFLASINTITSRPYVAPSWSWAARSDGMEFGTWGFHPGQSQYQSAPECNVVDAQCTVEGLDPFGALKSGYIVLSAKVLRLEKKEFSFTPTPEWTEGHYDWYLNGGTRVMQTFLDGHPESNDSDIYRLLFLLLGSCNDYGLEAYGKIRKDGAPNDERCAFGLVLYPAQGANTFYRVGLFNSQVRNHAPNGGLKFCDGWKTEEITIV